MEELEAGMIGLNTSMSPRLERDACEVNTNPRLGAISGAESPFGGLKESGYGKEAGKDVAVEEYLVTKAVSVALASRL
jgi:acyl-CoA reductase-like NAD-dependent aldehyde dehydrogenase